MLSQHDPATNSVWVAPQMSMLQVNTDMLQSLRRQRGVPEEKLTANSISAPESARRILELIDRLTLENTGSYWAADTGQIVEW